MLQNDKNLPSELQNVKLAIAISSYLENKQIIADFSRICRVAYHLTDNNDDYLEFIYAFVSGNEDWKSIETSLGL
jgi:hypothetical protein